MSDEPNAKVLFRVEYDDSDEADVEILWAVDLGEDNYKLDNLPYFAYGVSWHDVVYAPYDPDEEHASYKHVVSKSGNRTMRIIFDTSFKEAPESKALLDRRVQLGCDFENANGKLVVINIPPSVELSDAVEILDEADESVGWEYADPTYEELFPDDHESE